MESQIVFIHYPDLVWKVAYRTSAAPFYFKEEDNYIDGGLLANNPCEDALTAIQQFYETRGQRLPICLLVSVGSGKNPPKRLTSTINFGFERLINRDLWLDFLEVLESAVSGYIIFLVITYLMT